MERGSERAQGLLHAVARWKYGLFAALSVAGGLTLTVMVIGPTSIPTAGGPTAAADAASQAPLPVVAAETSVPESTELANSDTVAGTEVQVAEAATPAGDLVAAPAEGQPGVAQPVVVQPVAVQPSDAQPAPAPVAAPAPRVAPAVAPAPAPTPTTRAPVPTPAPTAAPTTPAPTTAAPTTPAPAAALSYPSYQASSAGAVVLQFDGSNIYVNSITPEPNWVFQVEKNGPRSVEVKFFNVVTKRDSEFHAKVDGGRIQVEN